MKGKLHLEHSEVKIPVESFSLDGNLNIPDGAKSIIIFSHGSGSSRLSPRNQFVAETLNKAGFATLLFDLLTVEEDKVYNTRFDIELLVNRLLLATDWVKENEDTADMEIGFFGSSTGAASALGAASLLGNIVKTVVSRGGRPDLAGPYLQDLKCSVLMIVGGLDKYVIELNEQAYDLMDVPKEIKIVNEATHLFEEAGKLKEVSQIAANWFKDYLKV